MSKKLVIVTRSMFAGGAERVIAQLANYFITKGIECTLVTIDNEKILYELDQKIKVVAIGKKANNKVFDKYRRYWELRKLVREICPDVVLSMPEDIGIYVVLALLGSRIPVFVSERNNPWAMPDVKATRLLRKLMYPFAYGLIFQTEMAKSYFSKSIQKKGVVIGNPVDSERIPMPFTGKREKIIVGAGRLDKQKNFQMLIEAFADFLKTHPGYELVIYGEGILRGSLLEKANLLGISQSVRLPGRKTDLLDLMNTSSMYVLSSDYEGMPNTLIEAMCMGMPVISTDCPSGGPHELIDNMENGILVPVNDVKRLSEAMSVLVDDNVSRKLSENAYKLKEKLTNPKVFEDWYSFLFKNEEGFDENNVE